MSNILTLNAGSATIKFSVYHAGTSPVLRLSGHVDALGSDDATLTVGHGEARHFRHLGPIDHAAGIRAILEEVASEHIVAVGHRIVHGGTEHDAPVLLDEAVLSDLEQLSAFAPLHQPHNLAGVRAAMAAFPQAMQIGCFDTAFHRGHPWVNDAFALPREYYAKGIRRYGFHGLSYRYIAEELARIDPDGHERCVVAHLGNGASLCALHDGHSVSSTMGFSALDGLPMGTRCGQLDPGVVLYLFQQEGMSAEQISDLLYLESGLKGLSGLSNDMRVLQDSGTKESQQAIDYFAFRIRREIGAMAAVLGGLDCLVFTGGIGENSAALRAKVCAELGWLGIALQDEANSRNDPVISDGKVVVRVVPTNEELVIARSVFNLLDRQGSPETP